LYPEMLASLPGTGDNGGMFLADMGVPMLVVQWPLMFAALLPVIALEAWILRRRLGLPFGRAVKGSAMANLASTVAGVPIAWAVMLGVELVFTFGLVQFAQRYDWAMSSPLWSVTALFGSAWTNPPVTSYAGIALAAALLLIPTFFLSVRIERRVCRRVFESSEGDTVNRAVRVANLWSYGLLFSAAMGWYGYQLAWGMEKAPPMRRVTQNPPIDIQYLHEVAIPAHDSGTDGKQFRAAAAKLQEDLAELDGVMRDVETGKVAVYRNLNRNAWESYVENKRHWISVDYASKIGPVRSFQIHERSGPSDYCIAEFGPSGFLSEARVPGHDFTFDDDGRVRY
jgi:hypothetical protein